MPSCSTTCRLAAAFALMVSGSALSGLAAVPLTNKGRTCPTLTYTPYSTIDPAVPWPSRFFPDRRSLGAQDTLPLAQSLGCIQNPAGFRTEVWAWEGLFTGPMKVWTVAFDERGRAWLCETFDYPNNVKSAFAGNDRIRILEDTDGDRVADKSTIFVDGLSMPTSLVFTVDGVLVAVEDHMVLFEDKDGDDKADSKTGRILYSGWSRAPDGGDTHGMANNLHYGLDNWIYGNVGYNGGTVNGIAFSSGSYRMRQDGSEFQWYAHNGPGNSWGWGQMEDGQTFGSHATGGGHAHHEVYQGMPMRERIMDHIDIRPITNDLQQGDFHGQFSATTGNTLYGARYFPREYWTRGMFVNEGEAHLVHQDFLVPNRSSWKASEVKGRENILASKDAWVAPVHNAVGPDGALWVVDFHNYLFNHNGDPPRGSGGAFDHRIRDNTKSRVYRVVRDDDTPLDPILDLSRASTAELVKQLGNSNMLWRMHAQRLLLRRGPDPEVLGLLDALLARRQPDETGLDAPVVHAIWTLAGLGQAGRAALGRTDGVPTSAFVDKLKGVMLHPSPAVRRAALAALPPTAAAAEAIRDRKRLCDPDPHVRLKALDVLRSLPATAGLEMRADDAALDKHVTNLLPNVPSGIRTVADCAEPALENPVAVAPSPRPRPRARLELALGSAGDLRLLWSQDARPGVVELKGLDGRRIGTWEFDGRVLRGPARPEARGAVGVRFFELRERDGRLQAHGLVTPTP